MKRMPRILAPLALLAALLLAAPAPARAQQEEAPAAAEGESSGGDSWYGYVGTGLLSAMVLFIVCKSARR
jgi:hypothetical protein